MCWGLKAQDDGQATTTHSDLAHGGSNDHRGIDDSHRGRGMDRFRRAFTALRGMARRDSAAAVDSFWLVAGSHLARNQTTLSDSLKPVEGSHDKIDK